MGYPGPTRYHIARSLTVSAATIWSNPLFVGDFQQLTVSFSTQSNAAINVQMSNADGFNAVIPENSWFNVLTPSVNSAFVLPVGFRWSRISTPASSNLTAIYSGRA